MLKTSQSPLTIRAVEKNTGLSKDTLRMWERRYRFPQPGRDPHGERVYPQEQVDKLITIKRLIDRGHRPGKLMAHSLQELQDLYTAPAANQTSEPAPAAGLQAILDLVKARQVPELRQQLTQALMRQGLQRFINDTVTPLNQMVGMNWLSGRFEIFEEHLYTETLQGVLRTAINTMPDTGRAPRILLTTLPGEQHGLGLLMAEAMLALERATCISLGIQTPVRDIVQAAVAHDAGIVALSFSGVFPATDAAEGLATLRSALPQEIDLWAGGSNAALGRRALPGVTVLQDLDGVAPAVAAWRAAHDAQ